MVSMEDVILFRERQGPPGPLGAAPFDTRLPLALLGAWAKEAADQSNIVV